MSRAKRKTATFVMTVTGPASLTVGEIRREVRTLVNEQRNYLSCDLNGNDIEIRVRKIKATKTGRTNDA